MAKFVTHQCPKNKLPASDQNHCKQPFGSMQMVDTDKSVDTLLCNACGSEATRRSPEVFIRSIRYPYYNDSLGERVENKDHELHVAKQKDMTHRDHGRVRTPKRVWKNKSK